MTPFSSDPNVGFDATHLLTLRFSSRAGGRQKGQLRDPAGPAETQLSLLGEGGVEGQLAARLQHIDLKKKHACPHLSLRSWLFQALAGRPASLAGGCCVLLVDSSDRTMMFAKRRLVFMCREGEREDMWLNLAVNGW